MGVKSGEFSKEFKLLAKKSFVPGYDFRENEDPDKICIFYR